MGIVNANNIFDESAPLLFVTGLIGMRAVSFCSKRFPGYIYVIIILFGYHAVYFLTITNTIEFYKVMTDYSNAGTIRMIQSLFNVIFVTFTIISSVYNSSKIRKLYMELNFIDERLKLLNIRFDYSNLMKHKIVRISQVVITTILFNLMEYYSQIRPDSTHIFILMCTVNCFPQFINSLAIANFAIDLSNVGKRLEAMNAIIPDLLIIEKNIISSLATDMNNIYRMKLLNKIHEKLITTASNINEAHGLIILTSFVVYFPTSCAHLHTVCSIYNEPTESVDLIVELLWVLFYIGKYISVIDACHSVTLQGKLSGELLEKIWINTDNHLLKNETDALTRRVESRNLRLTACNFFVIDYPTLKKIIVGLAAYVVFVTQVAETKYKK